MDVQKQRSIFILPLAKISCFFLLLLMSGKQYLETLHKLSKHRPFCLLARYIFVHIVYNKNNCLMNKELHSLFLLFFPLSLHLHQNKVCLQCQALLVGMQMQSNLNCVFLILQRQDTYFILCSGAPDIYKTQQINPGVWKLLPSPLALLMHPIPHNWEQCFRL